MRNSHKIKPPLSQSNVINKHLNRSLIKQHKHSLKSLDCPSRLKTIAQSCQKLIPTKSTRNSFKLPQKMLFSPKYFKKDHPSVQNRLKLHENKQNVKLPLIAKSKVKISQEKASKRQALKAKAQSGKKLATQPVISQFMTLCEQSKHVSDIKQSLLLILDLGSRKSVSIQEQIDKLSSLTKKGTSLRKHLRTIQQDILSLNLKKKLSKISEKNELWLLE